MAGELQISRESVRHVVKRDLGLSPLRLRNILSLTNASRQKRLDRSRLLIRRFEAHGLDTVLFTDEKIFTIQQSFKRQNDRVLTHSVSTMPKDIRNVRRTQKAASVVVWAGGSAKGKSPLAFVPQGCKVNAQNYEEHILEPVVKNLSQDMFQGGNFCSNKMEHQLTTSRRAQEWLRNNVPDFLAKEEWPPSSPDLNPMDFFCVVSIEEECVKISSFNC